MGKLLEIRTFLTLVNKKPNERLTTAKYGDTIEKATKLMLQKEFSQLPVIKEGIVVGVFSYESMVKGSLRLMNTNTKIFSEAKVEDCMEKEFKIYSDKKDLLCLLDKLGTKSYILIGERSKVTDIITSYDALKFFRTCGEDFLIINDIENTLRNIIAGVFDTSSFVEASKACLKKKPETVYDMEFFEYYDFIEKMWDDFEGIIKEKKAFIAHMKEVKKIRNKVCHFNSPLGSPNREYLMNILKWLKGRVNKEETYSAESLAYISLE